MFISLVQLNLSEREELHREQAALTEEMPEILTYVKIFSLPPRL